MAKSKKVQRDLKQEVTDKVIDALENGTKAWEMPWQSDGALPCNGITKRSYSGINVLMLMIERMRNEYHSNKWYTFKQMKDLGGHLLPNQKGTLGIFYKTLTVTKDNGNGEEVEDAIPLMRHFFLFNRDQIEGLPKDEGEILLENPRPDFYIEKAERLIKGSGIVIEEYGDSAYYRPKPDKILMPSAQRFTGQDAQAHWYATCLHELAHATGHASRLARPGITTRGSKETYAFEELVAELTAMMLCGALGIKGELRHESYILSWLKALRNDKTYIFKAAAQAQKATMYLLEKADMTDVLGIDSEK